MPAYDFSTLSPVDFEELSLDLLSRELGVGIERFKTGKDGGIDGRVCDSDGGVTIVQCKHYVRSDIKQFLSKIKSDEVCKAKKLAPKRYILVTSLPLNPSDKDNILAAYEGLISVPSDIVCRGDLNALLGKYPEVETRHFKLWIASTAVMEMFLNAAVHGRSRSEMEDVIRDQRMLVETSGLKKAYQKLCSNKVIVITGEPGVGKTTLARQLWMSYVRDGYKLYVVDSVTEAESVISNDSKQVFFFDDFLGSNVLDVQKNNSSSDVVRFIKRVRHSNDKRFILTSRSTIISTFRPYIKHYDAERVCDDEYEYVVADMTSYEKALLLYNHIWYYRLGRVFIDVICEDKLYRKIISHRNFNPRLVSYMTQMSWIGSVYPKDYSSWALGMLDNPSRIWEDVFHRQIDDAARLAALIVFVSNGGISEVDLRKVFLMLYDCAGMKCRFSEVNEIFKELIGSILSRTVYNGSFVYYSLFSPALGDYIIANEMDKSPLISDVYIAMRRHASIDALRSYLKAGKVTKIVVKDIIVKLIEKGAYFENDDFSTALVALCLANKEVLTDGVNSDSVGYAIRIISDNVQCGRIRDRVTLVEEVKDELPDEAQYDLLQDYMMSLLDDVCDYDECKELGDLVQDIDNMSVSDKYNKVCFSILCGKIHSMVVDEGAIDESCIKYVCGYEDEPDEEIDEDAANDQLTSYISGINRDIGDCLSSSQLDILTDKVDKSSIFEELIASRRSQYKDEGGIWGRSDGGDVDALFSRLME